MSTIQNQAVSTRSSATDKREIILRAAVKVFARKGYFNSKVSDIAKAANIADGTVYLYFKSKEEILHSVFDLTMSESNEETQRQLSTLTDAREKLRRLAQLHLKWLGEDRELAIVFQVEFRSSTKFMEAFSAAGFADYLNLVRDIIEQGQAEGTFRRDLNAKLCAKILYGALDEMATNWILSERGYELEPMADLVLDVFFNGVNGGK
ncbi:MAG: TetR/AcrR family transcriptional regulator [Pyrinomonadaceae bacterium]|nr:TetR/AcrR family transcriptional regulator [Pyrinomonadaceae bacterium]